MVGLNRKKPEPDKGELPCRVLANRSLTPGLFELKLEKPPGFDFLPGQRVRLGLRGIRREYTMISSPQEPELAFYLREVAGGSLSPLLAEAQPGHTIHLSGPLGYFTFRPSLRQAVFVATGTGLAPFVSMARAGQRGFILLHGVRSPDELHYQEIFQEAAALYVPCLSQVRNAEELPSDGFQGRTTAFLETSLSPGAYDFYLSGRREMIREAIGLVDGLFPGSSVFSEVFY